MEGKIEYLASRQRSPDDGVEAMGASSTTDTFVSSSWPSGGNTHCSAWRTPRSSWRKTWSCGRRWRRGWSPRARPPRRRPSAAATTSTPASDEARWYWNCIHKTTPLRNYNHVCTYMYVSLSSSSKRLSQPRCKLPPDEICSTILIPISKSFIPIQWESHTRLIL